MTTCHPAATPVRAKSTTASFPAAHTCLEDPELEADALLQTAGLLGRKRGIYTRAQLTAKIRRQDRKRCPAFERALPEEMVECLVEQWIDELVQVARLSTLEEVCFRFCYAGYSPRRIAAAMGRSRHTVSRRLNSARRKLRKAFRQGPYAGWREVYLQEVNRAIYRAPRSGTR